MIVKRALNKFLSSGFTLVELLIVIAILGILAAGIVVVINPMEKINSANLAKAKTFAAGVENSLVMSQVGKWSFDEESGKAKDTSGYGNDGTLYGGATRQTSAQCGLGFGGCMKFDGGYVKIPYSTEFNITSSITIAAWIKPNTVSGRQSIIFRNGPWGFSLDGNKIGGETGLYMVTSYWHFIGAGHISFVTGQWYHVVLTYDKTNIKTFVNGVLDVQENETRDIVTPIQSPLYIGIRNGDTYPFNGFIDEVQIYNKALLSYQIQQLYARGWVKHQLALK